MPKEVYLIISHHNLYISIITICIEKCGNINDTKWFWHILFPYLLQNNYCPLCRNPTLAKCEDEIRTPKVGDLESSGTPECLEFNSKAQNTSHWGVLGVIGKVLKCRCPKWPRIGHLDIYSPSYEQKKGRESNWQFDSRPLKVGNQPVPDVRSGSATWRWKALFEGYKFGSDLIPIEGRGEELQSPKVPRVQTETISGLHFGSPGKKSHSDATPVGEHKEYYREYGGGISRAWAVVCHVSPN
jgi:hypothetical protein